MTDMTKQTEALREAQASEAKEQPAPATELREQEPVAWMELLREARDNCKASIVEEGISAIRKEYRIDLEARLTAALNAAQQPAQQEPVAAECKFDREEKWVRCEIAHHNLVQSEPKKWPGYQTRLLYTSPPASKPWVSLTDEEIQKEFYPLHDTGLQFARAIEAKLREKNNR